MEVFSNIKKLENLIGIQKEKRDKILEIFKDVFPNFENTPKIEIEFGKNNVAECDNCIKIKIKDRSSIKFIILQNKEKIILEYSKYYEDKLVFN